MPILDILPFFWVEKLLN